MSSRVLITGGSGLLGLNWAHAIRDVSSVTLGIHDRKISLSGVAAEEVLLGSVDQVLRALDVIQPDQVVHAAGMTSVEECERQPALAARVNVELAVNVAKACSLRGLPLAHISTDHVFSGTAAYVNEDCAVAPLNVYGQTKAEAERRVLDAHPDALVIRTNFYGWGTFYRKSFSDQIIAALSSNQEITLFDDVFYTPILAERLVHVVHGLFERKASGVFHVVGDERISKYDFGLKVAEVFDIDGSRIKPGSIKDAPSLVQRPLDMSLSNQKVRSFLGRDIGGVAEHLMALRKQQRLAEELQKL